MLNKIRISFVLLSLPCFAVAQEVINNPIVGELNSPKVMQGKVHVMQDESIKNVVAIYSPTDTTAINWNTVNHVRVNGYKIQIFSGNNQRQSKGEAESKAQMVRAAYPRQEVTVTYNPPFWRVRAGNFLTRAEAEEVLSEMKKTFPSFGREMYIIENVPVKRIVE